MFAFDFQLRQLLGGILLLTVLTIHGRMEAAVLANTNPIARIARVFDAQLVQVEDRVSWLDSKVSTLSKHCEYPLKVGLGYRGCRNEDEGPDPSIVMDLGQEFPIDQIFLVPCQREFLGDSGIFPKRFTLEFSNDPQFAQRTILHSSGSIQHQAPQGFPVAFKARETARFLRMTVQEGHNRSSKDLFGLAELLVISDGEPISFGAKITTDGGLIVPGIWFPEALIDGRSPLGIWQNGTKPSRERGDAVTVSTPDESVTWSLKLPSTHELDRLVLFPYQFNLSFEDSVLPESLTIFLDAETHPSGGTKIEWSNPLPGAGHMTPLVIPLHGISAHTVRIVATKPWKSGDSHIHALSEIEVWSQKKNLAKGRTITRENAGQTTEITSLNDGYSSEKRIAPVGMWLQQLYERGRIERELTSLRSVQRQLASRSELNATWGSAVILGLTFLIPVFIVERRRLMSKEQLDHIRKRIASDLHDDIGSNLGSISLIARTARKDLVRLHGPEEIAEDLDEVETIARESSLAMRDIVWLLERRQDSIGDLVQRMRETANRLLREIQFTLECESNKTAAKLSLDAKRHLFLFYKEAIHNVLKHSRANRVSIRLWDEDDKLALEIIDNGIGLPTNQADDQPATVHKLEERARVLNGLLEVISSKESGTHIRLFVKRSHLNTLPSQS